MEIQKGYGGTGGSCSCAVQCGTAIGSYGPAIIMIVIWVICNPCDLSKVVAYALPVFPHCVLPHPEPVPGTECSTSGAHASIYSSAASIAIAGGHSVAAIVLMWPVIRIQSTLLATSLAQPSGSNTHSVYHVGSSHECDSLPQGSCLIRRPVFHTT